MSRKCDPELEDSKPIYLQDTLAHDVVSGGTVTYELLQ